MSVECQGDGEPQMLNSKPRDFLSFINTYVFIAPLKNLSEMEFFKEYVLVKLYFSFFHFNINELCSMIIQIQWKLYFENYDQILLNEPWN